MAPPPTAADAAVDEGGSGTTRGHSEHHFFTCRSDVLIFSRMYEGYMVALKTDAGLFFSLGTIRCHREHRCLGACARDSDPPGSVIRAQEN